MENLVHSPLGLLHLVSACLAILVGSYMLWKRKGTKMHKKIGYVYVALMVLVNGSAFGLYGLFGTFGVFHFLALVSLSCICIGLIPKLLKWKNGLTLHISWMYFSVIGLYAAFFGELSVRVPIIQTIEGFWMILAGASMLTVAIGMVVFYKKYKNWKPGK